MVALVMQGMYHTMPLRNPAVIATTDVLNMIVKARNKRSSKANLRFRHLRQGILRSKWLWVFTLIVSLVSMLYRRTHNRMYSKTHLRLQGLA